MRTTDARGGIGFHVSDGAGERPGMKKGVGVEQDQVATLSRLNGAVVGDAKAKIHVAPNEASGDAGAGKLRCNHLGRAVTRAVVDHQDLGRYAFGKPGAFLAQRSQTLPQQIARVEGDHDDGGGSFVARADKVLCACRLRCAESAWFDHGASSIEGCR